LVFGVECGGALLRRFRFSFSSVLAAVADPEPYKKKETREKPKRRSKAPPHSTPKPK
jgi:hypothetical protein